MGAQVTARTDGLTIRGSPLRGARVSGRGDHRVVMAMAVAALGAQKPVEITTAESAGVTFPGFVELLAGAGARVRTRA